MVTLGVIARNTVKQLHREIQVIEPKNITDKAVIDVLIFLMKTHLLLF